MSNFFFEVDKLRFEILRTGCWPYIKYHCTLVGGTEENLQQTDRLIRICKLFLFPACPAYGIAAFLLLFSSKSGTLIYNVSGEKVKLYFLLDEAGRQEFKVNNFRKYIGYIIMYVFIQT